MSISGIADCPLEDESWLFYRDLELLAAEYPDADINDLEKALLRQEPEYTLYFLNKGIEQ